MKHGTEWDTFKTFVLFESSITNKTTTPQIHEMSSDQNPTISVFPTTCVSGHLRMDENPCSALDQNPAYLLYIGD